MSASKTLTPTVLAEIRARAETVLAEVEHAFVGPRHVVELLLVSLIARGHILLEGVPGIAKTTLCKAFADTLGCSFRRLQFTPDLLPSDITGSFVLQPQKGTFELRQGPIFSNVLLGDEINRAPAKTQSALLEAMQERQATIEGTTYVLPAPFVVLATQNPVDQAGTYPLPEAQLDRFLVRIVMGYPTAADEQTVLRRGLSSGVSVRTILSPEEILELQQIVEQVHLEDSLIEYAVRLARSTREHGRIALGVSPRGALALVQAARARALVHGRDFVLPDDLKAVAQPVLSHRIMLTAEAELEGTRRETIIQQVLDSTVIRRST